MATEDIKDKKEEQEQVDGEVENKEEVKEEEVIEIPAVTIRLPSPQNAKTLPKPPADVSFSTFVVYPQPNETLQDLRAALNEWAGGYWLGPYSFRIPGSASTDGERGQVLGTGKENVEIREGEKLSDWLEVGDVFGHIEGKGERVLDVVREPYSESDARQQITRLREYTHPIGTTAAPVSNIGLNAGMSLFEAVRDETLASITPAGKPQYEEVEVVKGKSKGGRPQTVKVKREIVKPAGDAAAHAFADWEGLSELSFAGLPIAIPPTPSNPVVRSITLSPFNPPPPHLRQQGQQLYLQVSTLEGETVMLVCTTRGWHVSRSNVGTFDPSPRQLPDGSTVKTFHSLIDLLHGISPLFTAAMAKLPPLSTTPPSREPIATVAIPQYEPAYPWLASGQQNPIADPLRVQMAYVHTGATSPEGLDAARDWNEEIQGVREMPRKSMSERVIRERMAQKTWAEFTSACVRGVMAISRGDLIPLNPQDESSGHMWLASNIFFTKAVNSVDAYTHLGGDAAAHVSHAKDALGVKHLNKLDVDGVYLLGHTVVDWLGERWVCQSVLPGIFSRRRDEEIEALEDKPEDDKKEDWVNVGDSPKSAKAEAEDKEEDLPENPLIIHGLDSEKPNVLHWDAGMHKIMEKIASAQRLANHKMTDGKGKEFDFWTSVDVKGLRGSDGRRYLLDLPRLSPVDVEFLEKDLEGPLAGPASEEATKSAKYPHRVVLLRAELLETYWETELKKWARELAAENQKKAADKAIAEKKEGEEKTAVEGEEKKDEAEKPAEEAAAQEEPEIDAATADKALKQFELRFNADAFVDLPMPKDGEETVEGFLPATITDESDAAVKAVRDASVFLRTIAIPAVAIDTLQGNTTGIMDGASLSKHLHSRGINMRYLGHLLAAVLKFSGKKGDEEILGHLASLKVLIMQEMVFRASKHILRDLLRGLLAEHATCAVAHFLNCLIGSAHNATPAAVYEPIGFQNGPAPLYTQLTPESLRAQIIAEVESRFRWTLDDSYLVDGLKKPQLLRELAIRTGFQLVQRDYDFAPAAEDASAPVSEDDTKDKKSKKSKKAVTVVRKTTFIPSDILTMVPIIRTSAPSSSVAEEIFEAGRSTINRGNVEMGLDFMLEGINLYEQIHSVIHPEVAVAYNHYAIALHQLARIKMQQLAADGVEQDTPLGLDLATALRLQRQAVIVAERTLGIHHAETISYYYNLAMLENLENNPEASLRYFRYIISLWQVVYGDQHPELQGIFTNVAAILQNMGQHSQSLVLLNQARDLASSLFGPKHLVTGATLHQLTQAHFLAQDVPKAFECSVAALEIFEAELGKDNVQAKEIGKNVELLKAVMENAERQQQQSQQQRAEQLARLHTAQQRVTGTAQKKRVPLASSSSMPIPASAVDANGVPLADLPQPDVEELVKFIQGQASSSSKPRGKSALRGKKRTGAKR